MNDHARKNIFIVCGLWSLVFSLLFSGCATTEYHPLQTIPEPSKPLKVSPGIYHKVLKGQTLFRIAKAYGVDLDNIIAANNIPNAAAIEVNQLILIPKATRVIDIPQPDAASKGATVIDPNQDEFTWPMKGKVVGYFSDHKGDAVNKGIDIEASAGDDVKAARQGTVVLSDYLGAWGDTIILDHGDGFLSVYSHLANRQVNVGDKVHKGNPIGQVAQIGKKAILHFQIRKGQIAVNPLYYLS